MRNPIRPWITAVALATILAGPMATTAVFAESPAPAPGMSQTDPGPLKFNQSDVDFGVMDEGESKTIVYPFTNVGTESITVTDVRTSCGCTAAELKKRVFAPGESGEIGITFNSTGRNGEQHKVISVKTDNEDYPMYRLTLKAKVFSRVSISERAFTFGEVDQGESKSITVDFLDFADEPVNIKNVSSVSKSLEIKVGTTEAYQDPDTMRKGRKTPITVTIPETHPIGNVVGTVAVETDYASKRQLNVPLSGRVLGPIDFAPSRLYYGVLNDGQTSERMTKLIARQGEEMIITGYTIVPAGMDPAQAANMLKVDLGSADDKSKTREISTSFTAPNERGSYRGDLIINATIDGKETEVSIPFTAVVRTQTGATTRGAKNMTVKGEQNIKVLKNDGEIQSATTQAQAKKDREAKPKVADKK